MTANEKPKKKRAGTKKAPTKKQRGTRQLVDKVIDEIETLIKDEKLKPTVGDYLRLLQYREEIEHEGDTKEIRATWVEPEEKSKIDE
jgi:hypothetical protein